MKRLTKFAAVATLFCLPLLLTACAPSYRTAPPEVLLQPIPIPQPPAGELTFWDAYDLAVRRGDALIECNRTRLGPLLDWSMVD